MAICPPVRSLNASRALEQGGAASTTATSPAPVCATCSTGTHDRRHHLHSPAWSVDAASVRSRLDELGRSARAEFTRNGWLVYSPPGSLREFDAQFTAPVAGFDTVDSIIAPVAASTRLPGSSSPPGSPPRQRPMIPFRSTTGWSFPPRPFAPRPRRRTFGLCRAFIPRMRTAAGLMQRRRMATASDRAARRGLRVATLHCRAGTGCQRTGREPMAAPRAPFEVVLFVRRSSRARRT